MKALNLPNFTPELSLMLACLQASPDAEKIEVLCQQVNDWDGLVSGWVKYHRTLPHVYTCLKKYAWSEVPDRIREQLTIQFENNTKQSMANAATLVKICRLLAENNISFLAFKGPTLALHIYGHLNMRNAGDLDLLIDPSQIERADAVLQTAGYCLIQPDFDMSPKQKKVYQRVFHHFVHQSSDGSSPIELHWRLTYTRCLLPVSFEHLLDQSQIQMIGGHSVPTLSDMDMALYLFAHGANHVWFRLFWLYDVVAFIEQADFDWTELLARASEIGLSRPVLQGALLAHHLLQCPIPDAVLKEAMRDSRMAGMFRLVINRLIKQYDIYDSTVIELFRGTFFYLPYLRRDLAYKLSLLHNHTLNPLQDWSAVTLPDWLFPLYYVLRFPLWCFRKMAKR